MHSATTADIFNLQAGQEFIAPFDRVSISTAPRSVETSDPHNQLDTREHADLENSVTTPASDVAKLYPLFTYSSGSNTCRHIKPSDSSSSGLGLVALQEYSRLFEKLSDFGEKGSSFQVVEQGAVETAERLLHELIEFNRCPPMLSWHGGDAIVFIWTLGQKTEAVTVTDEEIGYVVRENKKNIKLLDSIFPQLLMLDKQK